MEVLPWTVPLFLATIFALFGAYCFKLKYILPHFRKNLPPGKQGFPLIGETISYIKALKQDRVHEWVQDRVNRFGPVFKTSLMGVKTVVITGQAGNRFILGGSDNGLVNYLPASAIKVIGEKSLSNLSGPAHKPIRLAIMSFLKPESIQNYVTEMNSLIQQELIQELGGKDSIYVVPLVKKITFKVTSTLLFGLRGNGDKKLDDLLENYNLVLNGTWSIPLNIPGTSFAKSMKARALILQYFSGLVEMKKQKFEAGELGPRDDILSKFVSENFSEEEIFDNIISLMIAGHDTTAVVVTLCIRLLGRDTDIFNKVLQEQREVVKVKDENGGRIRWSEIQMMKYTWRVAQEVMRLIPPVAGTFRLAQRDIIFGGFQIPKGWQVMWAAPSTHMDDNIFKDPGKFDPSRFENSSGIPPYSYVAFGAGPRVCPGSEFGRVQVLLMLHYMVTNYRWHEKIPNEPIERAGMPYPAKGLPINLRPGK
ncbi:OLC1v1027074C1 [Oldenlandia corymbosa var. corymbosa]|uniref:OLC1v1027074C1 n=1 Tax=Oldenlandia corymbosa var. corymbosa TaxID=529605 RepID=A0AAV1CAJ2_OLDCO|nr:OLC1v1027074C1 [Oldenlandia corymbosa var. corymbosa]